MSTVSVTFTQAAYNTNQALRLQNGVSSMSDIVDIFFQSSYAFSSSHTSYSGVSNTAGNLRLTYSDGAYSNFLGVVDNTPTQASGNGSATFLEQYVPQGYRLTYGGSIKILYTAGQFGPTFQGGGGVYTAAAIQTLIPSYSSAYNSTLGNVTVGMQGAVTVGTDGKFSGTLGTLTQRADKFISAGTLSGDFQVNGDSVAIGLNLGTSSLTGTLTGLMQNYSDGSSFSLSGASIAVTGTSIVDERLLGQALNFPNNDTFNVTLPAIVTSAWLIAAGAGNDSVTIKGGGSFLSVDAGTGDDVIYLKDHQHAVDGGAGRDTAVFEGARSAYGVTKVGATYTVRVTGTTSTDQLTNVERLTFSDGNIALDTSGIAGQAYRIYQAAFNRTPDQAGVGYWIRAMDDGFGLLAVAQGFVDSAEFKTLYGTSPNNRDLISKFYVNVLHRQADQSGIDFWTNILDSKLSTLAEVLVGFSESSENQTSVASTIAAGFPYIPYG